MSFVRSLTITERVRLSTHPERYERRPEIVFQESILDRLDRNPINKGDCRVIFQHC